MPAQLDHTIVRSHDRFASARFLAELIDEPEPKEFGPFACLPLTNGVTLDYLDVEGDITSQHLAFLVSDEEFDAVFRRITDRGVPYWADPRFLQAQQINRYHGGRGLYVQDPDGHSLEFMTRTYVIE
ncbi:VOC family protein [Streptomyces yaizuensis]|uniref:VOC family protein n=1 Tax=Streptomyces yaizuensis TaxID=2989713 RepID=A0ABQ5NTG4_9ACTN|nr:VOC family protein [Streptomyces sp. YSPA8]GLF93474.1 VOC family protein [Streptomyces sp. YSPA8]